MLHAPLGAAFGQSKGSRAKAAHHSSYRDTVEPEPALLNNILIALQRVNERLNVLEKLERPQHHASQ